MAVKKSLERKNRRTTAVNMARLESTNHGRDIEASQERK